MESETGRRDSGPSAAQRVQRQVGLPSTRAVVGGLLMALAAVGTFVAWSNATAEETIDVLVASRPLHAGDTITADDVAVVAVDLPDGVRGLFGAVDAAVGRQVVAPVGEGEFLQASATATPVDGAESLEVTVALPGSRSVGRLRPGDRVDLFSTWSGDVTELIAVDARVLEVGGGGGSLLGDGEQVVVRLGLADIGQVEAIVHAHAAGDLTMIRAAIGTEIADLGREYRPLTRPVPVTADVDADDDTEDEDTGDEDPDRSGGAG